MSEGTPRGGQSAWVVNWRNQQQRKNKSWENDGWLHVQGPTVTLYNEEGNKMGQKNFTRPLVEGQELSIAGKEIRVDDAISVRDLWAAIKGEGSSRGTPAPISRPGFFSHSTPQPQTNAYRSPAPNPLLSRSTALKPSSVNRPRSSLANNDVFRADTPEVDDFPDSGFGEAPQSMNDTPGGGGGGGSDKKWFNPKDHFQKPFKFPTPVRRTSPALEYGPSKVVDKGKRSRMQDQAEDGVGDSDEEAVEEERRREESNAKRDKAKGKSSRADEMARMVIERNNRNKGKAAASRDQDEEEEGNGKERENSPPPGASPRQEQDEPTPPKKRKVDNESQAVPRKPRVSAADLALSRSMSGGKSSTSSNRSSTSTDKQKSPSLRAAIQARPPPPSSTVGSSVHEQGQSPRVKPESIEDEELDSTLLLGSEYRDALGLGEEEEGMDWDEGDDLNEEGSLAGSVSERDASDSERSQGSVEEVREERVKKAVGSIGEEKKIRYFSCQWRKQTTKKNATWEGDGFLKIDKSGRATLKDSESGKEIGSAPLSKQASLEEDSVIKIGNKEVEISTPSDRQAWEGDDYDEDSVSTATVSSSRFNPPSSSRSMKPIVPRSSSAVSAAPRSSSAAAAAKSFAVPGLVKPTGIKSNSFYNNPTIDTTNNKNPSALFDPTMEGAVVMKRPDREHSDDYNKKGHPIVDVVVDPLIGDKLRPHQKEGVRFMYECVMGMSTRGQGCILADEMGLGKTIQSIALIWTLLKQNPYHSPTYVRTGVIERAMIVCPVTLIKNWAAEIKKWLGRDSVRIMVADQPSSVKTFANSRTYQILIVGYEKLTSAIETVKYAQPPVGLIICDEGHRLKSANTKTAKAIQTLSCQRRVILSGTPIQNNLGEFFAMMDFVNPGLLKDAAYFKKNYEQPILRSRELKASAKDKKAGKEAAESLSEIQRNFVLRRTSDLLQRHLPPKSEFTVFVVPTQLEIDIYGQVLASSAVRSLLSGSGKTEQLSLLMMLRKCANTPGLLMKHATEDKREESIFQSNLTDLFPSDLAWTDFALSAKLSTLAAMLRKLRQESDEKIVIVSNFTSTLDIIEKYCRKQKFPYCRLDGKTPQSDRISMVNGFNRGSKNSHFIFLLSSKSGGTGLNIIGASRLVLLDSEWNPSTDLQAMARIHRDGQTRPCFIYRFLTSGTIDEKIYQRQITKLALSGSVMEEDSTSASKKGDAFTMDDLKNIFRLHHDTACQTHDLIECKCHRGENEPESQPSQEAQDDSDDSEDERSGSEGLGGFVPASQWEGEPVDKKALRKAHRNLSLLKTWNHYDCSRAETVLAIEDKLLQMMIYELAEHNSEEREVRPFSMMSEEEQGEYARGERVPIKGGQIGWVFEKKKDEKKVVEEGEEEGEEED